MRAKLKDKGLDSKAAESLLHRMYRDPYINRVAAKPILDALTSCGLEPVLLDLRNNGRYRDGAKEIALEARSSPEELSIEGFEFLLRKSQFDWRNLAGLMR